MTLGDIQNYYANLLVLQYAGKPKAQAHIKALVELVLLDQTPTAVRDGFNISAAQGVNLDLVGKYVGVTRSGNGFGGRAITLDDLDFSKLIKLAIIRNAQASDLSTIQTLLNNSFGSEIQVFDYANMHMNYVINSSIGGQDLVQMFVSEGLLPKPMGVQLGTTIYASDTTHFFGARTYDNAQTFTTTANTYDVYSTSKPMLTYDDGVVL